jgi:anti-sigma B factor antagonist
MEITRHHVDAIAVLALVGRLTVNDTAGQLKAEATQALADGAGAVILDLSQVPYIDSTRLGELIGTHITVARQGGRLVLVCPTQRITALLKIAGLEGIFESYSSLDLARQAVLTPRP